MVNLKSKIRNHHLPNIPFLEDPSASFPGHVPLPLRPWQQSAWSDTWKWRRWRWTYFCYQVGVWKWGCTCTLISFFSSDRRKFRSKTSDNMERWKSRGGKSQRWEEKKNEDQRRERVRRKKMQVREKVENSRFIAFFQTILVAPEGHSVGSRTQQVRRHLARWEMKNCAALWREAHFLVKMRKAHTAGQDHFWKLICRKSARPRGAKHVSMSKCGKHMLGQFFRVQMWFCVAGLCALPKVSQT